MLFNSIEFLFFMTMVFSGYWFVFKRSLKLQNLFILVSSYVFYGWWDYRFLSLIILSTIVDYFIGLGISRDRNKKNRKILLIISMVFNLGLLGFFKYYNFFIESWVFMFNEFGYSIKNNWTLNIILPVGISFYTFQTMSYSIDIYREKLKPTRDIISFATFVAFFPQLVAGPIERATNLLPQILNKRTFSLNQALNGLRLILYGLVKKVVIADNIAPSVDDIFQNFYNYDSSVLILGAFMFSIQIYCDFSGYSMIARGLSKLLGFELMENFNFPYFSRNIGEFWRRWHISLSTWFRDYLYIPLGGSKFSKSKTITNIFIIFLVSGLWHGANWTFLIWGFIHSLLFIPSVILGKNRRFTNELVISKDLNTRCINILRIFKTFLLVTLCWIFFRSDSLNHALEYIGKLMTLNFNNGLNSYINPYDNQPLGIEYVTLIVFLIFEYLFATRKISLYSNNRKLSLIVDASLIVLITIFNPVGAEFSFIYFQF